MVTCAKEQHGEKSTDLRGNLKFKCLKHLKHLLKRTHYFNKSII